MPFLSQRNMKYNVFVFCIFLFGLVAVSAKSTGKDVKDKSVSASITSTGAGKDYNGFISMCLEIFSGRQTVLCLAVHVPLVYSRFHY